MCSYYHRPESFPPSPDRSPSTSPPDQGRRVSQCKALRRDPRDSVVTRVGEDILNANQLLSNLSPPLTPQQGIGIVECQTPIDIESVKNIHLECTFHSLFSLIDEDPPPILAASHLSFLAGQWLQPGTTTMVTKTTRERPSRDPVTSEGFLVKRMGAMLVLVDVRVLPLGLP